MRATPFRSFVLKLHARCNLRCDYCYVYEMADQGWRSLPRVVTRETIDAAALRIAEHTAAHGTHDVDIVFHGGEPLLAGPELIAYAVTAIRTALRPGTMARFSIQTNGLLLREQFLELFGKLDVLVGLSLDGDAEMHDRHRRHAGGQGSYRQAAAAAARLRGHRVFGGILSVIDLRNDPVRTYESLLRFSPPIIDFLLPHGNWSAPPPGRPAADAGAPYGDWLIAVFDRWYTAAAKETGIRLFEEIMNLLLGGTSRSEVIGLSPVAVAVIETDGGIAHSDVLTAAYPGAGATGLNVAGDPLDAALLMPAMAARQAGIRALAAQCSACRIGRVCGGGLYAHRYRAGSGFRNPSVYCRDLYRLITHVRDRLVADLRPGRRDGARL